MHLWYISATRMDAIFRVSVAHFIQDGHKKMEDYERLEAQVLRTEAAYF